MKSVVKDPNICMYIRFAVGRLSVVFISKSYVCLSLTGISYI